MCGGGFASREDMQLLLDDPDYFDAFFHTRIPQAIELNEAVSQQIQQNLELARKSIPPPAYSGILPSYRIT
jgi:hypothetical protein